MSEASSDVDTIDSSMGECSDEVDSPCDVLGPRKNGLKINNTEMLHSYKKGKISHNSGLNGGPVCVVKISPVNYPIDSVEWLCHELFVDVIEFMSKVKCERESQKSSRKIHHSKTMLRTVEELSGKHEILFKGMMNKLELDRDNVPTIFVKVVDAIFADKLYNWGRIVTVYAFAGWLARHCAGLDMIECIPHLAATSGEHVATQLGPWITKSGGWDAFDKFFEKPESSDEKIWKGLLYTIFGLGVGAVATAIVVK